VIFKLYVKYNLKHNSLLGIFFVNTNGRVLAGSAEKLMNEQTVIKEVRSRLLSGTLPPEFYVKQIFLETIRLNSPQNIKKKSWRWGIIW
jgi:hypothetical protein